MLPTTRLRVCARVRHRIGRLQWPSTTADSMTTPTAAPASSPDTQLSGVVDGMNMSANQLIVSGHTVTVTGATTISDDSGQRALADLRVGDQVSVRGHDAGGVLVATRIDRTGPQGSGGPGPNSGPSDRPPAPVPAPAPPIGVEAEFSGTIASLTGTSAGATLIVAGRTVQLTANTLVRRSGDAVAFDRLRVGTMVEVKGVTQSDGRVIADRITIEDDADAADNAREAEFSGTITSVSGTSAGATLQVSGRTVRTDANTLVRRKGDAVGFDRIHTGQRAEIKGVSGPMARCWRPGSRWKTTRTGGPEGQSKGWTLTFLGVAA